MPIGHALERSVMVEIEQLPADDAELDAELDAVAWTFLASKFTADDYAGWPLERRVEAYLRRYGPKSFLDQGSTYNALVERVMANVGRALRTGLLTSPHS
jgi:hypothetical protein